MTIAQQPSSPAGELTHKDYQNKVNEIINVVNPLDTNQPKSTIFVNSESDLPNVVGGVCTPPPNTVLHFANDLVLTSTFNIVNFGVHFEGSGVFGSGVTYNGTNDFIVQNEQDLSVHNIKFTTPNASSTFNSTATAGGLFTLFLSITNIHDSPQVAILNNVSLVSSDLVAVNFVNGFKFSGSLIVGFQAGPAYMQDDGVSGGIHFDLDDAVFLGFDFAGVKMEGTGIGLSSSVGGVGNIIPTIEAISHNCAFGLSGVMTPLSGFVDGSNTNNWNFRDCSPASIVPNSRQDVDLYLLTDNTISIASSGTFYEIGNPASGLWQSEIADRFTFDAAGFATYTGDRPTLVECIAYSSIEKAGGGTDELEMRIAINWTPESTGLEKTRGITQNGQPTMVSVSGLFELQTGDTVRLIFANNDSTDNIIAHIAKLEMVGR